MTAEQVNATVSIGDQVTMDRTLEVVGDSVMTKSLDDRVGVFVMIEALQKGGECQGGDPCRRNHAGRSRIARRARGRIHVRS